MHEPVRPLPRDREQLRLALQLTPDQRLRQLENLVAEMRLIRAAMLSSRRRAVRS
jgi:hypothetical protein